MTKGLTKNRMMSLHPQDAEYGLVKKKEVSVGHGEEGEGIWYVGLASSGELKLIVMDL